jgi:hypothetical protein
MPDCITPSSKDRCIRQHFSSWLGYGTVISSPLQSFVLNTAVLRSCTLRELTLIISSPSASILPRLDAAWLERTPDFSLMHFDGSNHKDGLCNCCG